ncbi:MAG: BatD family protein, partial [Bacteroidetes bacterium]|nr:BatD family protein [Bacteroidota bacterium]
MSSISHISSNRANGSGRGQIELRSQAAAVLSTIFIFVTMALTPTVAFSQTFTASVNNTTVSQNEQFEVSFTFSTTDVNGIKNFQAPDFKDFVLLSGPNQSTSLQFINGAASGSMTYSYYVRCPKVGKFTIGSASLEYAGKKYTTQPITIDVIKGSPKPPASAKGTPTVSANDIGDNVFILATADKQRVYLGQPVTVTYRLYTRLPIASQMQVSKLPSYEGFWAEEINLPSTISLSTVMYHGKQYSVGVLKKVALFPSQTGELSVTPMVLDIPVQIRQRQRGKGNVFDQFFNDPFFSNYSTVNFNAKSNTIKIEVLPL